MTATLLAFPATGGGSTKAPKSSTTIKPIVVTLTKVSHSAALSEETDAFEAIVCLDGVPSFHVSNHGTGGCNDHHPLKGQSPEAFRAAFDRLSAYAATLPTETLSVSDRPGDRKFEHQPDADWLIDRALYDWMYAKDYKRLARSNLVMIDGGKVYTLKIKKPRTPESLTAEDRDRIQKKNPTAEILNWLPSDVAVAKYAAAARTME